MSSENGSDSPSRDRNSEFSGDRVCRDFLRKVCRRGNRCKYVHPNEKEQDTGREPFTKTGSRTVVYLLFGYHFLICLECFKKISPDVFPLLSVYNSVALLKQDNRDTTNKNTSEVPHAAYFLFIFIFLVI
jgi:hypothetical protein